MAILPRHKISTAEKEKTDENGLNYYKQAGNYYIDQTIHNQDRDDILSLYRLLENKLDNKDYEYVLNPYNTSIDDYKRYGARLRNYNILSPVIDLYTGEFGQRFKTVNVLDANPDDDNKYKEGLQRTIKNYYAQEQINNLNALGIDTKRESQEMATLQEEVAKFNQDFDSNKAITGQEILDYIRFDQDIDDKQQDAYIDWLTCGRVITYKGIFHDDLDYEVVPPWEVTTSSKGRTNFIEDRDWIVRRQVMTANQILDRFHGKLTSDQENTLEALQQDSTSIGAGYVRLPTQYISSEEDYQQYSILDSVDGIEVFHVQWKGWRKVGLLTYESLMGQIEEMEVDDTYTLDKDHGDISIAWEWQSETNEVWRIGDAQHDIYVDAGPLSYNRMELNNSSAQKLSYNGRYNTSTTGDIKSIVKSGRPYQVIYNILHFQFEKTINKNKDKIVVMPQGLIPKGKGGWDEEKFMYYAHANSLMVIDETRPTAGLAMQGVKVLDMGLAQYAKDSIELMTAIKNEWWEAIGMNRQRYGDSKASDGKAVSEQAIFRSAIISDELNRKFEKFMEKDYAGLLDLSKLAYINGKKGKYINSDGREAYLRMNPDDAIHRLDTDTNIFVRNSRQESEKIQTAKEYGFSIAQNGSTPEMLELIDASNFAKTKKLIAEIDENNKRREEANQQAQQKSTEAIEQAKRDSEQATRDVEVYKADKDYDKAIDSKLLDLGQADDIKGMDDRLKVENEEAKMNSHKINMDREDLRLDKKGMALKEKETNAKIKALKEKPKTTTK